jgi:tryptophan-rich sensory protein
MAVTAVAAIVGSLASVNAREFYAQLSTPSWAPPGWLFGPVWTLLYTLMAIAAWQVWGARGWDGARGALLLYLFQLVVNASWSWLFFAWRRGQLALVVVIMLAVLIVFTMIAFARVRTSAALLLLPYLLWVSFASALNYVLWQRNPDLL